MKKINHGTVNKYNRTGDSFDVLIHDEEFGFRVTVIKFKDNNDYEFEFKVGPRGKSKLRVYETLTWNSPSNEEIKGIIKRYIDIAESLNSIKV